MKSWLMTIAALVGGASLSFMSDNRPVADSSLKKAQSIIEKHFDFQAEKDLFERAPTSIETISPPTAETLKTVKKYFENFPRGGVIKVKGPSAVGQDLALGAYALSADPPAAVLSDKEIARFFDQGVENYEKGLKFKEFPADPAGNLFLEKSYRQLRMVLSSLALSDKDSAKLRLLTLYMLGDIGTRLWQDERDLAGLLCLVETIRAADGDEIGEMAWLTLNSFVHFGHSGSSGDHTPGEWLTFLKDLEKFARGRASANL